MSDASWHEDAAKMAKILHIIVGAMCAGVAAFLAVTLIVVPQADQAAPLLPVSLTLVVTIFVVAGLVVRLLVISLVTTKARREIAAGTSDARRSDGQRFVNVFQTRTIISAAMFEGWAFLAVIAYMIERSPTCLGLSAFLLFGVSMHFPTPSRIIHWVEGQLDATEHEKRDNAI